ncbi:MAG: hypothetical protein HC803_06575 [Saprospiraceae bacterium]|nr:hypothetical protein [Saprospiraceae bacterium]
MSKQQINFLLSKANKSYAKRKLLRAIELSKQAMELASDEYLFDSWGDLYVIYGKSLSLKGQYESDYEALDLALEALETAKKDVDYHADLCLEVGKIYLFKKDYKNAIQYFLESLDKSREYNNHFDELSALVALSQYYIENQDLKMAEQYSNDAATKLLILTASKKARIQYLQNRITLGIRQHDFDTVASDADEVLRFKSFRK